MEDKEAIKRLFDEVDPDDLPYAPELLGVRYLSPGRIGLSFWHEKIAKVELRVANVWEKLEPFKGERSPYEKLFDESVFSEVIYYSGCALFPRWNELMAEELYHMSEPVLVCEFDVSHKEFICLK